MTSDTIKQAIKDNGGSEVVYNNDTIVNDIVKLIDRWTNKQKRPLYLYCIVTGNKCPMTAKALWQKRIDKCKGDITCLFTTYTSRSVRKSSGIKVLTGRTPSKRKGVDYFWRNDMREGARTVYPVTREQKTLYAASLVTDTCQRPDLVMGGTRCNNCPYALICMTPCKEFATGKRFTKTMPSKVIKHLIGNSKVWQPLPGMLNYDLISLQ